MDYPKPRIPTFPILSLQSFAVPQGEHVPSILDFPLVKFVTSGRVAIALALQQMKIGKDDKVLLPAYHCAAMVEPIIWVGATPVFYKIHPDTSVDLEDVRSRLDSSTKLILVAHYFGFPQDMAKIRNFCDEHRIFLLEDCAHSFFGEFEGRPLGSFGDYAVASSMKFFPIYEGGCLVSSRHDLASLMLTSAGAGFELKAMLNVLEKGFEYGRLPFLQRLIHGPLRLKNFIWDTLKERILKEKSTLGPGASEGGFGFEAKWVSKRSALISTYLIRKVSKKRIAENRRQNYVKFLQTLTGLPGCYFLFPDLPKGVFPYVFPLVVDDPEKRFRALKNAGIPVIRFGEFLWEGMEATTCKTSVDLSRRVLQFPCHQELSQQEMAWMISEIRTVLLS
ncbi:MAG: aminotransferase class I/II-fold pyridoxal phosphate-dependent enzyme [Nitrosospira multiformis]|nr:aminotransferase class I/II-fold pyridoxal phosphate-dependent enzyme [Nitrosospira multiformis]